MRAKNKKATDWLRKAGYLDTDGLQTTDYNNDTNISDLDNVETINYNNDTSVSDLIHLKKTNGTQLAAKKIIKKYKNLARKKPYQSLHHVLKQLNSMTLKQLTTIMIQA